MKNKHGEWLVPGSLEFRANLESHIGHKLDASDGRVTRKSGQPDILRPSCTYCGSIAPEDFIGYLQRSDVTAEVANMKYGWPHKIYLEFPNPNPNELREVGWSSGPEVDGSDANDRWKCRAHSSQGACGCTRDNQTGYWVRVNIGTFAMLNVKFHTTHLTEFADLEKHAELIYKRTGVLFQMKGAELYWRRGNI